MLRATVDWFEERGKRRLIEDYRTRAWLGDFLSFAAKEHLFATFLTPSSAAGQDEPDKRWDTARIAALNEILGFYGLDYWYAWQVTILGLGPVWQSENAAARARAPPNCSARARCSRSACPRRPTAPTSTPPTCCSNPTATAASAPPAPSTTSATATPQRSFPSSAVVPTSKGPDGYVFFAADSRHPSYHLVKNVVDSSKFVSEFRLEDYPVAAEDVLHTGRAAFDAALNTVNVGKFNLVHRLGRHL